MVSVMEAALFFLQLFIYFYLCRCNGIVIFHNVDKRAFNGSPKFSSYVIKIIVAFTIVFVLIGSLKVVRYILKILNECNYRKQ